MWEIQTRTVREVAAEQFRTRDYLAGVFWGIAAFASAVSLYEGSGFVRIYGAVIAGVIALMWAFFVLSHVRVSPPGAFCFAEAGTKAEPLLKQRKVFPFAISRVVVVPSIYQRELSTVVNVMGVEHNVRASLSVRLTPSVLIGRSADGVSQGLHLFSAKLFALTCEELKSSKSPKDDFPITFERVLKEMRAQEVSSGGYGFASLEWESKLAWISPSEFGIARLEREAHRRGVEEGKNSASLPESVVQEGGE